MRSVVRRADATGAALSVILAGVCLVGCSSPRTQTGFTEEELWDQLDSYSAEFGAILSSTAESIADDSGDRDVRRRSLIWQLVMVPLVHEAAHSQDPQAAYLSTLVAVVAMREYLEQGDGRALFGEQQARAIEIARQFEEDLVVLGRHFLQPQQLEQLRSDVAVLVERNPIRGSQFTLPSRRKLRDEVNASGTFDWIIDIPMSPFRALSGVGETPAAIRDFSRTAGEMTAMVAALPEQVRWQTQLLLYDVEDRDTLVEATANWDRLSRSIERIALAIDRLPDDLRATLGSARDELAAVDGTLTRARELADALAPVAEELRRASESLAPLLERDAPDPDARPFDVREWESAARQMGASAAEFTALTAQLRALVLEPQLDTALDATVQRAEQGLAATVDHAALRVAQLAGLVLGLALIYRLIAWRLPARPR